MTKALKENATGREVRLRIVLDLNSKLPQDGQSNITSIIPVKRVVRSISNLDRNSLHYGFLFGALRSHDPQEPICQPCLDTIEIDSNWKGEGALKVTLMTL
jgi:hypothetical protein